MPPDTQALVHSIMKDEVRHRFEEAGEVDFSYGIPRVARFRVNAYLQRGSIGAALRVIPTEIRTLEQLGLPAVVRTFAEKTRGMVLVTGPTGAANHLTRRHDRHNQRERLPHNHSEDQSYPTSSSEA